jgi:hypothetical protein
MRNILIAQIFAAFTACLFSTSDFAMSWQMINKDYWLKKHVPEVPAELCEGRVILCMGIKHEACESMFMPAAKACGEKIYASLPDYLSGKEMTKKYKLQIRECAWPLTREQVGRQIRGNPKPPRRDQCIEFMVPNAPTPKIEEWNTGLPKKPKPVQ